MASAWSCWGHLRSSTHARRSAGPLIAVMLAGCAGQVLEQPATRPDQITPSSSAPALAGPALTGPRLDIRTWRGHPVLIDFWGSWCGPCQREQPTLDALYRQFSPRGVEFVGVDERDSVSAGRAFVDEFHVPYPSLVDPSGVDADTWLVAAAPTVIIVDGNGRIRSQFPGTLVGIDSTLTQLLKTKQ